MGDRVLNGVGVSPGVAIGPAYVVRWTLPDVPHRTVEEHEVEGEVERLHTALDHVTTHVEVLRRRTEERAGPAEARIFDAQLLMLADPDFVSSIEELIRTNQLGAERAFEYRALELGAQWTQAGNAMLRQRRADLYGIAIRVLQQLLGQSMENVAERKGDRPVVVLTRELTPGLTVEFAREHIAGFVSIEGTRTSHAAILAHGLGIPCVMGVQGMGEVQHEVEVIVDGSRGRVILGPTVAEIEEAEAFERRRIDIVRQMESDEPLPCRTTDGVAVALRSNIDLPEELDAAVAHRANGVGLVRTEFLILGRTELPGEEEQADYFSRIARAFPGAPVVIRSYDLGGDKFPAAFRPPREPNPFLGWRAIRVCLDRPEIFRSQLRAILRARVDGDVQLMLPLVTRVDEIQRTRALLAEEAEYLRGAGIEHDPEVPVGAMVETPAAAMMAEDLAAHSDFLSVGTNDLTQYFLAVDRSNARLAGRFTPYHPAVVRALDAIVRAGHRANVPVSVCGEMASDPIGIFLLLGLGYTTVSVAPPKLSMVHWLIRQLSRDTAESAAAEVVGLQSLEQIVRVLRNCLQEQVDLDLLPIDRLPIEVGLTTLTS